MILLTNTLLWFIDTKASCMFALRKLLFFILKDNLPLCLWPLAKNQFDDYAAFIQDDYFLWFIPLISINDTTYIFVCGSKVAYSIEIRRKAILGLFQISQLFSGCTSNSFPVAKILKAAYFVLITIFFREFKIITRFTSILKIFVYHTESH